MRELLGRILREDGYKVILVADGVAAIARLDQEYALVITDMRMPGAGGDQVLAQVRRRWPGTPVVVLTAFGSISGAVEAMREGAFDYLTKPLPDPDTLRGVVRRALAAEPMGSTETLVAADPAMTRVVEQARLVAPGRTTVLLLGESGTGKEVVARLIHRSSPRAGGPFVAVNCAALSESLLESELFGHEKGAFTGAHARHEGRFEQANQGTLLLDEVGETSPALQAKLLRVLQERTFERVGGVKPVEVDVRLVAARVAVGAAARVTAGAAARVTAKGAVTMAKVGGAVSAAPVPVEGSWPSQRPSRPAWGWTKPRSPRSRPSTRTWSPSAPPTARRCRNFASSRPARIRWTSPTRPRC